MQNEPNEFDKVLNNGKHGQFFVPADVYIIGTMNDIDRSVESMDFAMRRRFAFYEVEADKNTNMLSQLDDEKDKAIKVMKALNNAIWNNDTNEGIEGLNSAYHIGASYFLKIKDYTDDSGESKDKKTIWKKLWHYHIKGILKEYLRGLDNAEEIMETLKNKYNDAADIKG